MSKKTIKIVFFTFTLYLRVYMFHSFGPIKEGLRDKNYPNDEEVKTAVIKCVKEE